MPLIHCRLSEKLEPVLEYTLDTEIHTHIRAYVQFRVAIWPNLWEKTHSGMVNTQHAFTQKVLVILGINPGTFLLRSDMSSPIWLGLKIELI